MIFKKNKKNTERTKEDVIKDITEGNIFIIRIYEETLLLEKEEDEVEEMLLSAADEIFKTVFSKYKMLLDEETRRIG